MEILDFGLCVVIGQIALDWFPQKVDDCLSLFGKLGIHCYVSQLY